MLHHGHIPLTKQILQTLLNIGLQQISKGRISINIEDLIYHSLHIGNMDYGHHTWYYSIHNNNIRNSYQFIANTFNMRNWYTVLGEGYKRNAIRIF